MSICSPEEQLLSTFSNGCNNHEHDSDGESVLAETKTLEQTFEDLDKDIPDTGTYTSSIALSQANRKKSTARKKASYFNIM